MASTVLRYEEHGDGNRPVMVFLHGFMGSVRSFRTLVERISGAYRSIAFDLPGHGASPFGRIGPARAPSTFEDAARLVLRDLDALEIGRFSLYGYSMGGRIAQNIAILAPGRIERLILESASFGIADLEERRARYLRDRALLSAVRTKADFEAFLAAWHRLPLFCTLRGTPHEEALIREKAENSVKELRQALAILSVGNHPFFGEELAALDIPLWYLSGERDEAYTEAGRSMGARLPKLTHVVFPGASHDIHVQFPEKIAEFLLSFTG